MLRALVPEFHHDLLVCLKGIVKKKQIPVKLKPIESSPTYPSNNLRKVFCVSTSIRMRTVSYVP